MTGIELLRNIEITLDSIPTSGEENLDRLLGCIRGIRKVRMAMEEAAEKKEAQDAPA